MRRIHVSRVVFLVLFPFFAIALASAVTPNPKLLSLVPPMARMVAGMNAPQRGGEPDNFLLITHNNQMDLDDFIALSGVDGSRVIAQVIMVGFDGRGGALAEHSLLAIGHFDQELIYKSVHRSGTGASATQYRGIPVLEMQPFARERDSFHDVRWLAMMDSHLALFGTMPIVQQEIDRYLVRSPADPSLERKLTRLRRDDDVWCVAKLPDHNEEIQSIFKLLDSRLAELLQAGDTIQLGVHYGRRVEFEYEVGMGSSPRPETVSRTLMQSLTAPQPNEASALPAANVSRSEGGVRGVLKVSKAQYEAWTAGILAAQADLRTGRGSSNR
jgi:hypothetical protein